MDLVDDYTVDAVEPRLLELNFGDPLALSIYPRALLPNLCIEPLAQGLDLGIEPIALGLDLGIKPVALGLDLAIEPVDPGVESVDLGVRATGLPYENDHRKEDRDYDRRCSDVFAELQDSVSPVRNEAIIPPWSRSAATGVTVQV